MLIREHMVTSGNWLFRHRSFVLLPLLLLAFASIALSGPPAEAGAAAVLGRIAQGLGLALVVAGLLGRVLTVGFVRERTSGRNTEGQVADELNTSGAYSLLRNPLYLANCLIYAGLVLFSQQWLLLAVLLPVTALHYERIIAAEEDFLLQRFGQHYREWAARTPAFWPRFSDWRAPELGFSWRMALRRELTTVLFATLALYLLALAQASFGGGTLAAGWHVALALVAVAWVALRIAILNGRFRKIER